MSTNFISAPTSKSQKLEAAILGAAMQESPALRMVMDTLGTNPDIFHHPTHQIVYHAMCALSQERHAVDTITVVEKLSSIGKLQTVGGPAGVCALTLNISGTAHIASHCKLLQEHYVRRRMVATFQQGLTRAANKQNDVFDLLATMQQATDELQRVLQEKRPRYVSHYLDNEVQAIIKAAATPQGLTGVPTGLTALDKVTGGWQKSDLIIVAGRPGMGKTSFLLAVGKHAACIGKRGAIFTLEVSSRQLITKLIATETGYSTSQLKRGLFDGELDEAYAIAEKAEPLRSLGLMLDDPTELTISALRAKAIQLKAEERIEWLAVDYLQLMKGDRTSSKAAIREQEISSISRGLKQLAKELEIPVIALSQLSREVEKRDKTKRPQLSDLRESGALEQDADIVIFLYRPEYYRIMNDEEGNSTLDVTEVIIAKHRNGSTADVAVRSVMKYGRYEDLTTPQWKKEAE
ncbi:replicative DNA helicase [Hymenobacter cheonanensis]|uniref:replicative DNA helicase n=1 Tax=Hymenobacter sp. CA2-7 TaxID=3063993 RepID=UPI0027131DC8|nr:replicative DNA helicase [Hymenobacter sp. CA2-7]MDO7884238.1 replicative DNA helicase [Hymenobacter sp. CA2-7]